MNRIKQSLKQILGYDADADYRRYLFEEVCGYLPDGQVKRVLEIGPKDGYDTRRLLTLNPEKLTIVELPRHKQDVDRWKTELPGEKIETLFVNLMYSEQVEQLEPYDLVWCTGVIYHNPEQLRMVRRLYDLLVPHGCLVLESATTRNRRLRNTNCVEIIYPPTDELKRKYRISKNITHLPSAQALQSWMEMVGFERVVRSSCHRRVSAALDRSRAAFIGVKPAEQMRGRYYTFDTEEGYVVGKSR